MPARNRNPIQISRVSLACLALLVAVCGGYFALVPFLKAIEPSPSIGEAAQVKRSSVTVPILRTTVSPERKPDLVANQLRPKTHTASKPKKPAAKKKHATTTVPTRPVLVSNPVRTHSSSSTPAHTTAPTHTQTHVTPKKTPTTPSRNRGPILGDTNQQGSGLAGRGSDSGARVTGGVSSTPGH